MARTLEGRVVLLTGAAGGIGQAIARRFTAEGARLALADRDEDGLAALARALPDATVHPVDLTDRTAIPALVQGVLAAHGSLDVVVANAGWTVHGRFEDMDLAQIDGVLEVDLRSVLHLVHHALPHLSSGGHLVLMASMAGATAFPFQTTYSAAKHGLVGFGDALRIELAARGIGVTTLLPGTIATPFLANAAAHDDTRDRLAALMQRYGTSPDRVAAAALGGIRRNRGRVRVGWDAHLVGLIQHACPPLLPALLTWAARRQLLGRR